ncbi:MAG: glycosyltransferase [Candidatus Omnitrophota bacterium]|nr:glycosyltransferase [Candidatus Omnitrophota bacterium]
MKHYIFLRILRKNCGWGGFEKRLLEYFESVDYTKTRVTLVTNFDIHSGRIRQKGLPVEVKLFPLANPSKPHMPLGARYRFLASLKPDVIVLTQGAFTDFILSDFWAAFMVCPGRIYSLEALGAPEPPARSHKKFFSFIPGFGLWWYKHMLACGLKGWLCRYIVCNGNDSRDRLVKWYGYPRHKTVTVYHGVDLEVFHPDAMAKARLRHSWGIGPGDKVIVSTARLSPEKRIDRLIDAFGEIDGVPSSWLFLVGEGPLRKDLERLAGTKKNAGRIVFVGFQECVMDFLQMSDIFALPSDIEGLSNAMLEAMAVGLVPVVTDVPGAGEAMQNGVNGFIVQKSTQDMYAGLRRALMLSGQEAREISSKARECILTRFNQERGTRETLERLGMAQKQLPLN